MHLKLKGNDWLHNVYTYTCTCRSQFKQTVCQLTICNQSGVRHVSSYDVIVPLSCAFKMPSNPTQNGREWTESTHIIWNQGCLFVVFFFIVFFFFLGGGGGCFLSLFNTTFYWWVLLKFERYRIRNIAHESSTSVDIIPSYHRRIMRKFRLQSKKNISGSAI